MILTGGGQPNLLLHCIQYSAVLKLTLGKGIFSPYYRVSPSQPYGSVPVKLLIQIWVARLGLPSPGTGIRTCSNGQIYTSPHSQGLPSRGIGYGGEWLLLLPTFNTPHPWSLPCSSLSPSHSSCLLFPVWPWHQLASARASLWAPVSRLPALSISDGSLVVCNSTSHFVMPERSRHSQNESPDGAATC